MTIARSFLKQFESHTERNISVTPADGPMVVMQPMWEFHRVEITTKLPDFELKTSDHPARRSVDRDFSFERNSIANMQPGIPLLLRRLSGRHPADLRRAAIRRSVLMIPIFLANSCGTDYSTVPDIRIGFLPCQRKRSFCSSRRILLPDQV